MPWKALPYYGIVQNIFHTMEEVQYFLCVTTKKQKEGIRKKQATQASLIVDI